VPALTQRVSVAKVSLEARFWCHLMPDRSHENDMLYVADSESRNVPGQYGYNPGFHRGIRFGSVNDGVVTAFIPDPAPKRGASFPEGISVDRTGTIWGASIGDRNVLKFVLADK
jgi:hypothetical protein